MKEQKEFTELYFNHHTQIIVKKKRTEVQVRLESNPHQFLSFMEIDNGKEMGMININRNEILYFREYDFNF